MRVNLTNIATLASLGAVSAVTPLPPADRLQPGHVPDWVCHAWEMAGVGDTCQVVVERNRVSIDRLIEMNPQIGSVQDCATKLLAGFFYCIATSPELPPGGGTATGEIPGEHERGPPAARPKPPPPPPALETQPPDLTPIQPAPPLPPSPAPTKAPEIECRYQSDNECWKMWAIAGPNYSSRFGTFCANVLAEPRTWTNWDAVKGLGYPNYQYMDFACQTKYQANPQALTTLCECLRHGSVTRPAGHPFTGVWCGQYSRCRPD